MVDPTGPRLILYAAVQGLRWLIAAAQRHRDAVEFDDGVVQELAAAKWALEAGRPDRGLDIVANTLNAAQSMVSQMLRDADAEADGRVRPATRR